MYAKILYSNLKLNFIPYTILFIIHHLNLIAKRLYIYNLMQINYLKIQFSGVRTISVHHPERTRQA